MNKHTKIAICVLAIFIVGMTLSVAFAEPVNAKKYKNKNNITVKVKDGKKTIKVKCKYKKSYKQYLGSKKKNGERYSVFVCYEKKNGMQMGRLTASPSPAYRSTRSGKAPPWDTSRALRRSC